MALGLIMNNEEQKRLFSWGSSKLVIPELYIFNLTLSQNSVELNIKSKEKDGLKEVYYTWSWQNWDKFFEELEKFNRGVIKIKNFKDKVVLYNLGEKLQTNLYFTREQWIRLYKFISESYKSFGDQRKIFNEF